MASRVGVNLRASAYLHQGERKYMEDEFQVAYQRTRDKKDIEYAYFGIFDGHGGKEAAHFAKDNLMDNIVSQRSFWSFDDEEVLSAIKEGFLQTHLAMWRVIDTWPKTASGWPSTSGTTASVAFIRRQKIYLGHVGDSGIVLGYEDEGSTWRGESLTTDHKPESHCEKNRIIECGGKVINKSGVPRIVWNRPKSGHQGPVRRSTPMDEIPFLAVARSLGDLWSYNPNNNEFVVSPVPDVCVIHIDVSRHRCLIFGTDGLWNVLTPDMAVDISHLTEKNNEKHYLGITMPCGKKRPWINPSRSIVTGALEWYQRLNLRADNTSTITVFLDPPGRPKREVLLQQKGIKKGSPVRSCKTLIDQQHAAVRIHIYEQNQTHWERGNSSLQIRERLPALSDSLANLNQLSDSEMVKPLPDCVGCNGSDFFPPENDKVPCWECSCTKTLKSDKSHSEEHKTSNDIQIPVISSSTLSKSHKEHPKQEEKLSKCNEKQMLLGTQFAQPLNEANTQGLLSSCNNNKLEGNGKYEELSNSHVHNRVFKSVNRNSLIQNISSKRKRTSSVVGHPILKSARIQTRYHTWITKPMITRSQERTLRIGRKSLKRF